MKRRAYCSQLSLAAGESLAGTATAVDVWILLEYPSLWRAEAIDDNELEQQIKLWLSRQIAHFAQQGLSARLQFIRQPEIEAAGVCLFLATREQTTSYTVPTYQELLDLDLSRLEQQHQPRNAPLYFVCTNGQRDLCCARFGLPTYRSLRASVGARVWQTTHLGGHRFAPNVLTLPSGMLCGRVLAAEVATFLATIESGGYPLQWARGRSFFPVEVQAAEKFLAERDPEKAQLLSGSLPEVTVAIQPDGNIRVQFGGLETRAQTRCCVVLKRTDDTVMVRSECATNASKPVQPLQLLEISSQACGKPG